MRHQLSLLKPAIGERDSAARTIKGREYHSFPLSTYSAPGDLRQDPGRAAESLAEARNCGNGSRECVCCCPRPGRAGTSNAGGTRGAEVRACAPPDFAERLADVGVLVPVGRRCAQW